jgi:hypothetical protein
VILALSKLTAHKEGDCALNFTECPLFKVGMCCAECTGKIRAEDLAKHTMADAAIVSLLVAEVLASRKVKRIDEEKELEADKPSKRPHVAIVEAVPVKPEAQPSSSQPGINLFVKGLSGKVRFQPISVCCRC